MDVFHAISDVKTLGPQKSLVLVTGPMKNIPQDSDFASLAHGSAHANAAARVVCTPRRRISRATIHKDILKSPPRMCSRAP